MSGLGDPSTLKVLVVDDDAQMRSLLERILGGRCVLLLASNGREGLEIALREWPDIILTDNEMPLLKGIEMVRAIRKSRGPKAPRIFLMTGSAIEGGIPKVAEAGADECLFKPFTPEELLDRLGLSSRVNERGD